MINPDMSQYYETNTPIPVYQPSLREYDSYLASVQDTFSISDKGINTLIKWYDHAKMVL